MNTKYGWKKLQPSTTIAHIPVLVHTTFAVTTELIIVVSLPPHCSHRLKPLAVTVFSPLKTGFNQECDLHMKSNHFDKIAVDDIASISANVYNRVCSIENGGKGFEVTGIYPLDRNVFNEGDFAVTSLDAPRDHNSTPPPSDSIIKNSTTHFSFIPGPNGICSKMFAITSPIYSQGQRHNSGWNWITNFSCLYEFTFPIFITIT